MEIVIYKDGECVNRIVASEEFAREVYPESEGYTYEVVVRPIPEPEPEPDPMTQAEIEETLIDIEYRLLLLEYGLEEEVF